MWTRARKDIAQPASIFAPIIANLFDSVDDSSTPTTTTTNDDNNDNDDDDDSDNNDDQKKDDDGKSGIKQKPRLVWRAWWTR